MSVGVKPIRIFLEKMNENSVFKCIVVYKSGLTPSATKVMASLAPKYIMEQFSESELVVNITEHKLVPQHIVLSDEEKKALLARYRLKDTQLPRILIYGPGRPVLWAPTRTGRKNFEAVRDCWSLRDISYCYLNVVGKFQ